MILLSRKEHFNAAHSVFNPSWSEEKNKMIYGACANKNGHGHNFELIITVKGEIDPDTGFIINTKKLSELTKKEILTKIDHKNINHDVDFMAGKIPSCENLIIAFWDILEYHLPKISSSVWLHRLKLYETPRNFVVYHGNR